MKKDWSANEALRKRDDIRSVHQLQPLNATLSSLEGTDSDDADGSNLWLQREMDRRKAMLHLGRPSNRKVFSGSRHTRTLSLLSPDKTDAEASSRRSADFGTASGLPPPPMSENENDQTPRAGLARSSTTGSSTSIIRQQVAAPPKYALPLDPEPGTPHEVILKSGKRIATDLKDGLWTFFEDLRQATVGEEGVNGTHQSAARPQRPQLNGQSTVRRQSSRGDLKSKNRPMTKRGMSYDARPKSMPPKSKSFDTSDDLIDIGGSFWREHGLESPDEKPATKLLKKSSKRTMDKSPQSNKQTPSKASVTDDDPWEMWDTPKNASQDDGSRQQNTDALSALEGRPPSSHSSSQRDRDAIPWPNLVKLSPSNLKRTASHLMNEWERSLTPPAEDGDKDYMSSRGADADAAPVQDATMLLR